MLDTNVNGLVEPLYKLNVADVVSIYIVHVYCVPTVNVVKADDNTGPVELILLIPKVVVVKFMYVFSVVPNPKSNIRTPFVYLKATTNVLPIKFFKDGLPIRP